MDYGKQRNPKTGGKGPRHAEHNAPGGAKNPFGARPDKTALVEKLKAAAAKTEKKSES